MGACYMKTNKIKCYSWSRYWSNGCDYHVFEIPRHCGYTRDLDKAGVFDDNYREILFTKEDVQKAKNETDNKCYYIPVDRIHLLGNVHKTVQN